jgi:hypothetical protein
VSALSWLLFVAFGVACFAVGWTARGWRQEAAEYRAEDARDAAWDAAWRSGTVVMSTKMADGHEAPSASLTTGAADGVDGC